MAGMDARFSCSDQKCAADRSRLPLVSGHALLWSITRRETLTERVTTASKAACCAAIPSDNHP